MASTFLSRTAVALIIRRTHRLSTQICTRFSSSLKSNVSYPCLTVNQDGSSFQSLVTFDQILQHGVSPRDILPLHLQDQRLSNNDHQTASTMVGAVMLPRHENLIVSFGYIKAIVRADRILIFDSHSPGVKAWSDNFIKALNKAKMLSQHPSQPFRFYMFCLEEILILLCEMFERRIRLVGPLTGNLANTDISLMDIDGNARLQKIITLQDSLSALHDLVKDSEKVLVSVINTADDLKAVAAIETNSSCGTNDVEIMLECYASRLSHIGQRINYDSERLKRRQSAAMLSASARRTRLLQLNLHVSLASLTIASVGSTAGLFGMNLNSGLEDVPGLFYAVMAGIGIAASSLHGYLLYKVSRNISNINLSKHEESMSAIQNILGDFGTLDCAINNIFDTIDKRAAEQRQQQRSGPDTRPSRLLTGPGLSREEFRELLTSVKGNHFTISHCDAFFDLLDEDGDGYLEKREVKTGEIVEQ